MREWFARVARIAGIEARQVLSHRIEWIAGFLAPLLCCLMMALLYGQGLMTRLPVGLVDLDASALSRETAMLLDALPSVRIVRFGSNLEADRALRARETYATVTIPKDYELENRRGAGLPLLLEIHKTFYAVGTIIELDVKTAASAAKLAATAVRTASAAGGTFAERARRLRASLPDVEFLGNPGFNFVGYMLPTFIPGLMALGALLGFLSMLSREWREGGLRRLLAEAGGSPSALVVGKLLPWSAVWLVAISVWTAGFAGWAGWGAQGPVVLWIAAGWLLILAMAGLALLATALSPTWVIAVSAGVCLIAPSFPFTGFSFPLESMTPGARFFGMLLPLTHYLSTQSEVWVLGSPVSELARSLLAQALFPLSAFAAALPVLSIRIRRWAAAEERSARLTEALRKTSPAAPAPRTGFWKSFLLATKSIFLSRDTVAIAGGAVAFYLILYGWPYSTQQLEHIPVGVVDLDRSSVSRQLISELDAAPAVELAFITHSEGEALAALKRRETDVIVTIPANYAEALARGENTTVHVLGNGAYPVKTRAIQGAVGAIAGDGAARVDEASVLTPGLPPAALGQALMARPGLVTTHRFNEIAGYGNFTVPLVGPIIIQAVMLMCVGMGVGGWLARTPRADFVRDAVERPCCEGVGILLALTAIAFGWTLYMHGFAFSTGEYGAMLTPPAVLLSSALYALAVVAFGLAITAAAGSNGWIAPLTVILSAPALFASGAVWPVEAIHPLVAGAAQLLPSTPYIPISAAAAQNGAALEDVLSACLHLALLALLYGAAWLLLLGRNADRRRDIPVNDFQ